MLFPFATYWWLYLAFIGFVVAVLAADLGLFHRKDKKISLRESSLWTLAWVSLAFLFAAWLYWYAARNHSVEIARRSFLEFLAGYVVEESLSLDNIFVFVLIFRYFAIPAKYQHRVLFFGILGAVVFRGVFIAIGATLIQYHWVVIVFGGLLIVTGIRMLFPQEERIDPSHNPLIRLLGRFLPLTTEFHGHSFLTRAGGRLQATPLLVTVTAIESTDILFAIDSVPAVFALTRDPFIVFTSNIFAILGLRSMYFMLAGAIDRFALLKYGIALVLVFVGVKMTVVEVTIGWSLAIIGGILASAMLISALQVRRN